MYSPPYDRTEATLCRHLWVMWSPTCVFKEQIYPFPMLADLLESWKHHSSLLFFSIITELMQYFHEDSECFSLGAGKRSNLF